jgi:hypothetical protein
LLGPFARLNPPQNQTKKKLDTPLPDSILNPFRRENHKLACS